MNAKTLRLTSIKRLLSSLILLVGVSLSAHATADKIHYSQDQIRDIGFEIAHELRCPMSINQNLFDSQAPIANELKAQIFLMLEQGESKQTIVDFLVQRYGEKIKYQPSFSAGTAILWFGPLLLLLGIVAAAVILIREQNKRQRTRGEIYE